MMQEITLKNNKLNAFFKFEVYDDGRIYDIERKKFLPFHRNYEKEWCFSHYNTEVMVKKVLANTFLPNPNNYKYIIYKDGNKDNIRVDNLMWVEKKSHSPHYHHKKYTVIQMDIYGNILNIYPSIKELPKEFNKACVSCCCRGEQGLHRGCKWKYGEKK